MLECRERERYAIDNVWGFPFSYFRKLAQAQKLIVPEARFHAESIGASPLIIARKTARLFKFLQLHSQRERRSITAQ